MSQPDLQTETDPLLQEDNQSIKTYQLKKTNPKKFWAYCAWGCIFIIAFNLTFLPRTSLSRDFRRVHGVKVTKPDAKRHFLGALTRDNFARKWLYKYTHEPHLAGKGLDLVKFTETKFKEFGLETFVESYDVWLNTPISSSLKLLDEDGDVIYDASLLEDVLLEDDTTGSNQTIPAFHGYSANGNVTAEFIFANFGTREDFAKLKSNGIEVRGKIVIIRYGGDIFRGLKVKFAQQNGAIGVILYSDPYDDGEITVAHGYEAYPKGKARNPSSLQRGSVEYFTDTPGDPTTPGYASKKGCHRKDPSEFIPQIPSIPVSSRSIAPILQKLNNLGRNLNWGGDIDGFDYYPGPSLVQLNLVNLQDYHIKPIYNVIGKIEGILPGEEIMIANHRDAWVVGGAADPNSGSAVVLEVARGFHELLQKGWKPLRTITFASWDGEEYSMLGSTEHGEDHAKSITKKQLVYLNLDVAVSGSYFQVSSNPLVNKAIHDVSKLVPFRNENNKSLFDFWLEQDNATISSLGAGTDFVVFQHHLGIPSVDLGFTDNGVTDAVYHYHSNYDSFHWMDTLVDPDYSLHNTVGKFLGLLALDLSEHEIAHFQSLDYTSEIKQYFKYVAAKVPDHWLWYPVGDGLDKSVLSDLKKFTPDGKERTFEDLVNFTEEKISKLVNTSAKFDAYAHSLQESLISDYPWFKFYKKIALVFQIKVANLKLVHLDRFFITTKGLKNREWMKHSVFGPNRETGYHGDVMPGLHEAVRDLDYEETVRWMNILVKQFKALERKLS